MTETARILGFRFAVGGDPVSGFTVWATDFAEAARVAEGRRYFDAWVDPWTGKVTEGKPCRDAGDVVDLARL